MAVNGGVCTVDLEIKLNEEKDGAKQLMKHVRPQWNGNDINFIVFTEGITNILIGCYEGTNKGDIVLVRIYGAKTDLIIDREMEMTNMQLLHSMGLAPPLYCKFTNGIVYGFMPGVCLDESMARDETIARFVAREMAKMHRIDPDKILDKEGKPRFNVSKNVSLFKKMRKWIEIGPSSFDDPERNKRLQEEFMSKETLIKELDLLENHLKALNASEVFTHHDLLLKNVVYTREEEKVTFIDYEYGAFGYAPFDIGNHFNEFAGVDEVDYSRYPEKEFQVKWIRYYLESHAELDGKSPSDVTEKDIESLYVQTNKFALASNFFWGLWALIQAKYSTINFDYLEYAALRLNEYLAKKDQFLALEMPK